MRGLKIVISSVVMSMLSLSFFAKWVESGSIIDAAIYLGAIVGSFVGMMFLILMFAWIFSKIFKE